MPRRKLPDWVRLHRGAEHVHQLGPRAVAELLNELGTAHGITAAVLDRLEAWRKLKPAQLAAVLETYAGGRQFPPALQAMPEEKADAA
jgi:hypothetical protein